MHIAQTIRKNWGRWLQMLNSFCLSVLQSFVLRFFHFLCVLCCCFFILFFPILSGTSFFFLSLSASPNCSATANDVLLLQPMYCNIFNQKSISIKSIWCTWSLFFSLSLLSVHFSSSHSNRNNRWWRWRTNQMDEIIFSYHLNCLYNKIVLFVLWDCVQRDFRLI